MAIIWCHSSAVADGSDGRTLMAVLWCHNTAVPQVSRNGGGAQTQVGLQINNVSCCVFRQIMTPPHTRRLALDWLLEESTSPTSHTSSTSTSLHRLMTTSTGVDAVTTPSPCSVEGPLPLGTYAYSLVTKCCLRSWLCFGDALASPLLCAGSGAPVEPGGPVSPRRCSFRRMRRQPEVSST